MTEHEVKAVIAANSKPNLSNAQLKAMLERNRDYYRQFLADIDRGVPCLIEIHINSQKHGIGNPAGCKAAICGMIAEIERQIADAEKAMS